MFHTKTIFGELVQCINSAGYNLILEPSAHSIQWVSYQEICNDNLQPKWSAPILGSGHQKNICMGEFLLTYTPIKDEPLQGPAVMRYLDRGGGGGGGGASIIPSLHLTVRWKSSLRWIAPQRMGALQVFLKFGLISRPFIDQSLQELWSRMWRLEQEVSCPCRICWWASLALCLDLYLFCCLLSLFLFLSLSFSLSLSWPCVRICWWAS